MILIDQLEAVTNSTKIGRANSKMRVLLTIALLSIISTFSVNAQTRTNPDMYIGFTAGGDVAFPNFFPSVQVWAYPGFFGGATFQFYNMKAAGFAIDINYMQSGWSEVSEGQTLYKRRLNYIHIPALTKFNIGAKKVRLSLNMGPFINIFINENEEILSTALDLPAYYGKKIDNSTNFGLCGGLSLDYLTKTGKISLDARYQYAFSDMFESYGDTFRTSQEQLATVTLGYFFKL